MIKHHSNREHADFSQKKTTVSAQNLFSELFDEHVRWVCQEFAVIRACSKFSNRDLTQMRTGCQRTAFEIHNCRNATIKSYYLLLYGQI